MLKMLKKKTSPIHIIIINTVKPATGSNDTNTISFKVRQFHMSTLMQ